MLGVAVAAAQTKIITQIVKRNVIENIVPIVIAVKHMVGQLSQLLTSSLCSSLPPIQLAEQRSVLLKDTMLYLKELMQDYRTEIKGQLHSIMCSTIR